MIYSRPIDGDALGIELLNPEITSRFIPWLGVSMTPGELVKLGLYVVETRPGRRYAELMPGPMHPENIGRPVRL